MHCEDVKHWLLYSDIIIVYTGCQVGKITYSIPISRRLRVTMSVKTSNVYKHGSCLCRVAVRTHTLRLRYCTLRDYLQTTRSQTTRLRTTTQHLDPKEPWLSKKKYQWCITENSRSGCVNIARGIPTGLASVRRRVVVSRESLIHSVFQASLHLHLRTPRSTTLKRCPR